MRTSALLLGVLLSAHAALADVVDLSGGEARRSRRVPTFSVRAEGGTDYAPYGLAGAVGSYFTENALGGTAIEVGAGAGFPGVQLGLALKQLFGEAGDYFGVEISIAGNTVKKLGYDPIGGHLSSARSWSALGVGFEHRQGFIDLSLVASLAFTTSFDLVPHPTFHGGLGFAF